ncbi:MAG: hypothetical protein ACFCUJ_05310 [Thiotrichales bacterium]
MIDHPLVESIAVPLAIATLLTGLLWRFNRPRWAGAAVVAALLVASLMILDGWHWPALTGLHKLAWLFAATLALQLIAPIGTTRGTRVAWAIVALAILVCGLIWIGWPRLSHDPLSAAVTLGALLPALLIALMLLTQPSAEMTPVATSGVVAALGLAGVAFFAGSLALMQLALATAAAVGGFALWNWPRPRFAFNPEFAWLLVTCLGLLVALVIWLTPVSRWALAPLLLIAALPMLVARLPLPARWPRAVLAPLLIAVLAAPLAGLAVWLALPGESAEPDLYYH